MPVREEAPRVGALIAMEVPTMYGCGLRLHRLDVEYCVHYGTAEGKQVPLNTLKFVGYIPVWTDGNVSDVEKRWRIVECA